MCHVSCRFNSIFLVRAVSFNSDRLTFFRRRRAALSTHWTTCLSRSSVCCGGVFIVLLLFVHAAWQSKRRRATSRRRYRRQARSACYTAHVINIRPSARARVSGIILGVTCFRFTYFSYYFSDSLFISFSHLFHFPLLSFTLPS